MSANPYNVLRKRHGGKICTEDYEFQGLDIPLGGYETDAENRRSLDHRFAGQITPLGTPLAVAMREGWDYLSSSCGYCGWVLDKCKCTMLTTQEDLWTFSA